MVWDPWEARCCRGCQRKSELSFLLWEVQLQVSLSISAEGFGNSVWFEDSSPILPVLGCRGRTVVACKALCDSGNARGALVLLLRRPVQFWPLLSLKCAMRTLRNLSVLMCFKQCLRSEGWPGTLASSDSGHSKKYKTTCWDFFGFSFSFFFP